MKPLRPAGQRRRLPPSARERERRRGASDPRARERVLPIGYRAGLTREQAHLVDELISRADRLRPLHETWRHALRIAGIVSAVKGGRVGNRQWGLRMLGRLGGLTLARHTTPSFWRANLARGASYRFGKRRTRGELHELTRLSMEAARRRYRKPGTPDWWR